VKNLDVYMYYVPKLRTASNMRFMVNNVVYGIFDLDMDNFDTGSLLAIILCLLLLYT
jgi:hypothetical protein